ncbi:hypothetical protein H0H92_010103, partial [Tricholoma furcatifolium]
MTAYHLGIHYSLGEQLSYLHNLRPFKNPHYAKNVNRRAKNLKNVLSQERERDRADREKRRLEKLESDAMDVDGDIPEEDTPSYTSIEAPPSLLPHKHYCDITGLEAPYTDPATGLRYHDKNVYDVVKSLSASSAKEYLSASLNYHYLEVVPHAEPMHSLLSLQLPVNLYVDTRTYGVQGPTKNVRLYRATPGTGGAISKSEDGSSCAVTGKESLRILTISDGSKVNVGNKSSVGQGGHRIEASRNLWEGSGLKIDSASTDVAWGYGIFNSKILTSARNGELIMWDLNKNGVSKYDGDMRVWDLRDLSRSIMRVHHPTSVRSVVFSPSNWQPLQTVVGLDNGNIYRWDLKMGQRGLLDRLPVAHTSSITSLDWCTRTATSTTTTSSTTGADQGNNGMGWLVSGGLDRSVKVWDLTASGAPRIPTKPTYTLHPSFPVRRVVWRPSYECELAIVSNAEFASGSNPDLSQNSGNTGDGDKQGIYSRSSIGGDAVEIWDVRRGWIPKWYVTGSAIEGGVTDLAFSGPDAIWTQSSSGTFAQIDLRHSIKPLDAITSTAASWESSGSLAFAADVDMECHIPYDDVPADRRTLAEKQHVKLKSIGDSQYVPKSQNVGTFNPPPADDTDSFDRLARGYIFHAEDRPTICAANARVAFQAGKEELAQIWLLLGASLADLIPANASDPLSPTKPPPAQHNPHPVSSPAIPAASYTFPSSASTPSQLRKSSPNHGPAATPLSTSTSASRKITPVSSNASSPRQLPTALPSTTPRRPSFFSGPRNSDSDLSRRSSLSMFRRPSISVPGSHSLSPADKTSLRHVGEGALDDSDSSSEEGSEGESITHQSSDEEAGLRPLISPGPLLPPRIAPAPSPLSRVAGQNQWTEDEEEKRNKRDDDDDSSSPSPRSTDTDSPGPSSLLHRRKSSKSASRSARRRSSLRKSRSRSSTVASLAAPQPRPLVRQDSQSSILTVLAGEGPQEGGGGLRHEETLRDLRAVPQDLQKSVVMSELAIDTPSPPIVTDENGIDPEDMTDRHVKLVSDDENVFRSLAWAALRDALENLAEEGNIQMCAMLSVVAPQELRISKRR